MTTQNSINTGLSGTTGTGNFVGATSPTLITPTLGAALATSIQISNTGLLDTNGNVLLAASATASAVNAFTITNAASGNNPTFGATGSGTNLNAIIRGKGTGGVAILGFTDGSSASTGYVGELITANAAEATTGTSNNTKKDVLTLSLGAGDWDVWGSIIVSGASTTTFTEAYGWINNASTTNPGNQYCGMTVMDPTLTVSGFGFFTISPPMQTFSSGSSFTAYLTVVSTFAVSTCGTGGFLAARRVR